MKGAGKIIITLVAFVVFSGLTYLAVRFLLNNQISETNRSTREAGRDYRKREYVEAYRKYGQLVDSMQYSNDAALLNYANAGYLSSTILDDGLKGTRQQQTSPDTLVQQLVGNSVNRFSTITTSENREIASFAFNQLGYVSLKSEKTDLAPEKVDSLLIMALENFKMALRRNPDNDSARYNYELLKKTVGFAETVLNQTKSLVVQKRYIEAATLLESSMKRDARLLPQRDFLNRIKSVAGIDTSYTPRRL